MVQRMSSAVVLAAAGVGLAPATASAHADVDFIAVPAGSEAVVTLRPTHGCDDSPTTDVRIRIDVPGATAVDVPGWTATMSADEEGRPIAEWSGGSLPSDQDGAFPIEFIVPDAPGTLLRFPAVQRCLNGGKLNWTSDNIESPYPAPRVLILPAGSKPAKTIDEVPLDALGRSQLTEVADLDNPAVTTTTAAPTTSTAPASTTTTSTFTTTTSTTTAARRSVESTQEPDDGNGPWIVALASAVVLAEGAIIFGKRRARKR